MENYQRAKQALMSFCAYQDRCTHEAAEKAIKYGLTEEEIARLLGELQSDGFIDEERYAKSFVRGKFFYKKWGRRKIAQTLRMKNLQDELINIGMEEIPEAEYAETMADLARAKWKSVKGRNDFERKMKVLRYLAGKGFEADLARDILDEL
ncbi:hypothetical protein FUAX_07700 [Fulvitalea axinellae]|uniref:Regulatory protein RecX n=1 Tax=Fulvitalea axinellae TaxID=1182444 RepID=A0AAU9CER4_9BACT|nr:hypothetical protein FUAX_07700 [Fulvitalea axinellae]